VPRLACSCSLNRFRPVRAARICTAERAGLPIGCRSMATEANRCTASRAVQHQQVDLTLLNRSSQYSILSGMSDQCPSPKHRNLYCSHPLLPGDCVVQTQCLEAASEPSEHDASPESRCQLFLPGDDISLGATWVDLPAPAPMKAPPPLPHIGRLVRRFSGQKQCAQSPKTNMTIRWSQQQHMQG
jgi:hypothetical protein